MGKSQKELAFLRDLYITTDWTERFTSLVDKHLELPRKGEFLFINTGTGDYAIALREKLDGGVKFFGVSDNQEILKIARAKANTVKADISFRISNDFSQETFDAILADASFVRPKDLREFLRETINVAKTEGEVLFFLPTAGSFGEIFSCLWETFFNLDSSEKGAEVERLITELPTVSQIEKIAEDAGLEKIETQTKNEIFEYETGAEFVGSTLVQDFLLPVWLEFLNKKEKKQVIKKLAQTIDTERDGLTYRFSVKATLVSGEKI